MTKFGVLAPQGWRMDLAGIKDPVAKFETTVRVAQEAEKLGFDSVWLYDHFHTVPTPELEATFECWTSSAALARETSRIRIGQFVTCNGYRNPALLAKMASTLDVLSHGRLDFGIGAGWYEHEYTAYGYTYPDAPERLRMLREALQVIHAMWNREEAYANFEGQYYRVAGAINEPKGVQKPHPPIWIGGSGEKVTLKLVAQYGDACNIGGVDPEIYRHKFSVLREHCDKVGRDYNSIIRSTDISVALLLPGQDPEKATAQTRQAISKQLGREFSLEEFRRSNFAGSAQEAIDLFGRLIEAGVNYFVVYLFDVADLETLHLFASEVVPALR